MASRETYCKAHMVFSDVTALADGTPSTSDNQRFADVSLLKDDVISRSYATLEMNKFVLDDSKTIISDDVSDISFMSLMKSGEDCIFSDNPAVMITFTQNHTSAGLTLYFADEYPVEIIVTWYTLGGEKLISRTFYPDDVIYVCKEQVENYGKVEIEFVKTRLPYQYARMQRIIYGLELEWVDDDITSAKTNEEIDTTSSTLSINTANVSVLDENNDFDIENQNGAWKSVQKFQKVTLTEYVNSDPIPCGVYFIDGKSFSGNVASFELVDSIGLMDSYKFDKGSIYLNTKVGSILADIFSCANIEDYEIDDDIYNIELTGTLAIQTCREALQMVCFVSGAVADCSRTGVVKVFSPNRHVKHNIPISRKFQGSVSVDLEEYVSGISIACNKYSLENDLSDIYDDVLSKGLNRIEFSDPYDVNTITVSCGTIVELYTNYIVVSMNSVGQCQIRGRRYESSEFSTVVMVDKLDSNEVENIKSFGVCTLYNANIIKKKAQDLLSYYSLRKMVKMDYIIETEQSGEWISIQSLSGNLSTSLIESQTIDLTGGFLSTASCRGYTLVQTDYCFSGSELYCGGNIL